MVFSLDPSPLHRPLGVVFGAAAGGVAWIGVERAGAETFALVPPAEVANAAGKRTRALKESASGVVLVRGEVDEAQVTAIARAAAEAGKRPVGKIAVIARGGANTAKSSKSSSDVASAIAAADPARAPELARWLAAPRAAAIASARGIVDGVGVSALGIAAGRPLPRRSEGITALLLTDASFATNALARFAGELAERSFGQVAGIHAPHRDDAIVVVATGAAGTTPLTLDALGGRTLLVGAVAVAQNLVQQLLERSDPADRGDRGATGAALVVQITVSGAPEVAVATRVAEALAEGRVAPHVDSGTVARIVAGSGVDASKLHVDWKRHAARAALRVDLALGRASATRWTAVAET